MTHLIKDSIVINIEERNGKMGKTEEIIQILRNELQQKKYVLNSRFPSEYELADRFAVNKKTVNKAVSLLVAEKYLTRGRGGRGTIVSRLSCFPKNHIAFVGNIQHPFIAMQAYGVQVAALEDNSLVSIIAPPPNHLNKSLIELDSMNISGIITTAYGMLPEMHVPILYLEDKLGEKIYPDFVACDSYRAGYQMMKELIIRGHRNIIMLFQSMNNPERLQGYYDAMKEAGIADYKKRTFLLMEYTVGETNMLLTRICRQFPGFTAVAACSDDDIYRMIVSMRLQKMEWIGKIAMVGFGNLPGISNIYPIATVDQHPLRIGADAYRLLIEKIKKPEIQIQEYVDTELVNLQHLPVIK